MLQLKPQNMRILRRTLHIGSNISHSPKTQLLCAQNTHTSFRGKAISQNAKTVRQSNLRYSSINPNYINKQPSVSDQIKNKILSTGPISISEYMKTALTSPLGGYYTRQNIFGHDGDFITSPEISQMFGEVIGIWYIMQWKSRGCPESIEFIELGPGKGTLMSDILRISKRFPSFAKCIKRVHFVETSAELRKAQAKALFCDLGSGSSCVLDRDNLDAPVSATSGFGNINIQWSNNLEAVTPEPSSMAMVMAHEFFDAIPIYRFQLDTTGWSEVLVDVIGDSKGFSPANPESNSNSNSNSNLIGSNKTKNSILKPSAYTSYKSSGGNLVIKDSLNNFEKFDNPDHTSDVKFKFVRTKRPTANSEVFLRGSEYKNAFEVGKSIEISPESVSIAQTIAKLVDETNGAALVVDYGKNHPQAATFRGISKHKFVNPLLEPGTIDLTADVDFSYLSKNISTIANTFGPVEQGDFLHSMGIQDRLKQLLKTTTNTDTRENLVSAYKRLVDPVAMGKIYKFLAITPKSVSEPPVAFSAKH